MTIRLHNVIDDQATTTVVYGGETGKVTYRPNAITPALMSRAATAQQNPEEADMAALIVDWICTVVADWDVEGTDGTIPLDHESIAELPMGFLSAVVGAVAQDAGEPLDEGEDEPSAV